MATRLDRVRGLVRFDALLLAATIWFLAKFLRYAFPPLFPAFRETFAVSNATLGAAFTAMMGVYAATQFPSGALADRAGAVAVVVGGAIVAAGGALVLAVPVPFAVLVGAMLLVGLGTGAHKTVAVRLLSRTYPARTGRALGVLDTFGALGGVAAPAAVVAVGSAAIGWQAVFLVGGLAGLGLAGAFALRAPRRVPEPPADRESADFRTYLRLFRDRRFAAFVALTLCFSFAYNGVVAFLPLYLTDAGGVSQATASGVYSVLFLASFVQLATGDLSDRVGRLPVIGATLTLAAAALAALVALGAASAALLTTAAVAFGVGSHGFRPVRGAYLSAVIPESAAGGGLGVVRTLLMGAGAIAPAVVGWLADRAGFETAFGLLAVVMAGAAVLAGVVWLVDRRLNRTATDRQT